MSSPTQTASTSEVAIVEADDPARRTFTDGDGREWILRLDFDAVDEVIAEFKLDLGDVEHFTKTWATLLWDDRLALRLLWHLVKPAAGDVSEKAWRKGMDGPRLEEARTALFAAIFFFTPPPKRKMLTSATAGVTDFYHQAIREAETKIEKAVSETVTRFKKTQGNTASKSRASSARSTAAGRSATHSRP